MKSPFTGGEAALRKEQRVFSFRGDEIEIVYHFYRCEDTGEQFTTDEVDMLNIKQVHNKYRVKHNLPFPHEMKNTREKYGLSARRMSLVLGFGPNTYRNYENGEIPLASNARLIQLISEPEEFKKITENSDVYEGTLSKKLLNRINELNIQESNNVYNQMLIGYLMGSTKPNEFTGYAEPNLLKLFHMIVFFAERMQPYKTGLNKLLFYSDFYHFKHHVTSISGGQYRAIPLGPVPQKYSSIFEEAFDRNYIRIEYNATEYGLTEKFFPNKQHLQFDPSIFEDSELDALETVHQTFKSMSATEIKDLSHDEPAWTENESEHRLINYEYAFRLMHV